MIILHIAIQGDNKEHAKKSLLRAIQTLEHDEHNAFARESVYRAWIEPVDSPVIDREIEQMPEVVR